VRQGLNPILGTGDDGGDGDPDGDGFKNREEMLADTNPKDNESVLSIVGISQTGTGVTIRVKGGVQARRLLQFKPGLTDTAAQWTAISTAGPPTSVTNVFAHARPTNSAAFYRIRIE
jgi:hypothetical protein